MAATVTFVFAKKHRLVYEIAGDGTATTQTIANATLLGNMVDGPLKTLWSAAYANQGEARAALLYGNPGRVRSQLQTRVNDVTAEKNQPSVDVNASANLGVVEFQTSDTTGQVFLLELEYVHTLVQ